MQHCEHWLSLTLEELKVSANERAQIRKASELFTSYVYHNPQRPGRHCLVVSIAIS